MKMKIGIGMIVLITLLVGGSIAYGGSIQTYVEVKQLTGTFFDELSDQQFEAAFESVGYYDFASDVEPTISKEDAKMAWVTRMEKAYNEGTYVEKVFDVGISFNDTYPSATAIMHYLDNGEWQERVVFISYIYQDGWKIGSVGFADENGAVEHPLTTALSGYVPE